MNAVAIELAAKMLPRKRSRGISIRKKILVVDFTLHYACDTSLPLALRGTGLRVDAACSKMGEEENV